MKFRTPVDLPKVDFAIEPLDKVMLVGSCFATEIGRRFQAALFPTEVNPFGVMYNPASIVHTIARSTFCPRVAFLTLGTNHVYRLKATGEIVDNCEKRPQNLFTEETLSVAQCAHYLFGAMSLLKERRPDVHIVLTVSPIRYAKYGFHGSQLSKATLLLAAEEVRKMRPEVSYFPAYELMNDELRDYRFYASDMLHPSSQAVDYIWEQLVSHWFSPRAVQFLAEWEPIKKALAHRPFNPDSPEALRFREEAEAKKAALLTSYLMSNE